MKRESYKRLVIYGEILVLVGVLTVLYAILWNSRYENAVYIPFFRRGNWAMVAIYPIMLLVLGKIYGIFNAAVARRVDMIFSHVFNLLTTNVVLYFILVAVLRKYPSPRPIISLFLIQAVISIAWVFGIKALNNTLFPPHNLLLIHGDYSLKELVLHVNERSERYRIAQAVSVNAGMDVLIEKINASEAVLISDLPAKTRNDILKYCFDIDKRIYMLPKITDIIVSSSQQIHLFDNVVYISKNYGLTADQRMVKRFLDIVLSGLAIAASSWLMLIIAILIKLDDAGPVFYKQKRLTINGREFNIVKFRSMRTDAESEGPQLASKNDSRVTAVGRLLRASHLDELPQFFNVFAGSMSLVGPRPERPEIANEYSQNVPEFKYRLKVKAGLTGYAQVYGRYNSTPYNKLRLDLTYIQKYSVWLDIKCLVMTLKILFQPEAREGVDEGQKTAEK